MSQPVSRHEELFAAASADIEAQVRKDTAGLDPVLIETIVSLVLKFGPSLYKVILRMFHVTPKA